MIEILGIVVTVGISAIGAIIWLVRLEGRINSNKQSIDEVAKDVELQRGEITGIKAQSVADTKAHEETKIALVRVEEQLKHLTDLVERLLVAAPRRRTADQ